MKKTISLFLSIIMLFSLTITGCAADKTNTDTNSSEIILQINNPNMTVNGTEKPIDGDGTVPVIVNDRTLLPVRAVAEEMGETVQWDGSTKTVTLNYEEYEIKLITENNNHKNYSAVRNRCPFSTACIRPFRQACSVFLRNRHNKSFS